MKKWLSNNLLLKIFSLLFAVLFWFYLTVEQEAELGFPVKVNFTGLTNSLVVSDGKIDHATVWLRGVRRNLFNLRSENMSFNVNLKEAGEGTLVYPLTEADLEKLPNVVVKKIVPSILSLKIEKLIKKRLYVKPKISGAIPKGYKFINASVSPTIVQVRGRRSVIQSMKTIYTYPIDISTLTQTSNFEVPLDLNASELKVTSGSRMIKIRVNVEENIINKTFPNISIALKDVNNNYKVDVKPMSATLEVKGPEILLDNLKPVDIKILVSAKNLPAGRAYKRRASVEVPEKVSVLKISPNLFSVKRIESSK